MKYLAFLLLAGCATPLDRLPPVYGCEGLEEYGCPDWPPPKDTAE